MQGAANVEGVRRERAHTAKEEGAPHSRGTEQRVGTFTTHLSKGEPGYLADCDPQHHAARYEALAAERQLTVERGATRDGRAVRALVLIASLVQEGSCLLAVGARLRENIRCPPRGACPGRRLCGLDGLARDGALAEGALHLHSDAMVAHDVCHERPERVGQRRDAERRSDAYLERVRGRAQVLGNHHHTDQQDPLGMGLLQSELLLSGVSGRGIRCACRDSPSLGRVVGATLGSSLAACLGRGGYLLREEGRLVHADPLQVRPMELGRGCKQVLVERRHRKMTAPAEGAAQGDDHGVQVVGRVMKCRLEAKVPQACLEGLHRQRAVRVHTRRRISSPSAVRASSCSASRTTQMHVNREQVGTQEVEQQGRQRRERPQRGELIIAWQEHCLRLG